MEMLLHYYFKKHNLGLFKARVESCGVAGKAELQVSRKRVNKMPHT